MALSSKAASTASGVTPPPEEERSFTLLLVPLAGSSSSSSLSLLLSSSSEEEATTEEFPDVRCEMDFHWTGVMTVVTAGWLLRGAGRVVVVPECAESWRERADGVEDRRLWLKGSAGFGGWKPNSRGERVTKVRATFASLVPARETGVGDTEASEREEGEEGDSVEGTE